MDAKAPPVNPSTRAIPLYPGKEAADRPAARLGCGGGGFLLQGARRALLQSGSPARHTRGEGQAACLSGQSLPVALASGAALQIQAE
jgi:hypothetical protein